MEPVACHMSNVSFDNVSFANKNGIFSQTIPFNSQTGQNKYSVTQPSTQVVKPILHCLPSLHVLQLSSHEQRWLQLSLSGVVGFSVEDGGVDVFAVVVTSVVTVEIDVNVVVVVVVVISLIVVDSASIVVVIVSDDGVVDDATALKY